MLNKLKEKGTRGCSPVLPWDKTVVRAFSSTKNIVSVVSAAQTFGAFHQFSGGITEPLASGVSSVAQN